jgi:hypothetical protein
MFVYHQHTQMRNEVINLVTSETSRENCTGNIRLSTLHINQLFNYTSMVWIVQQTAWRLKIVCEAFSGVQL